MAVQIEKVVKVDHYNGLEVNIHNNEVYILAVHAGGGGEGAYYRDYAFPEIYDKKLRKRRFKAPPEKPHPIGLKLGTRAEAVETLERVLAKVKGVG